ncbi:hypothetical protein Tco_0218382 [Tanacetum coccineum]
MDEDIQEPGNEETQTHHSTDNPTKEPILTKHLSPSPNRDNPKPSYAKKSVDALDSESSSCSANFKPFDNYMPITKRQLTKHEKVATSYTNHKATVQGFAVESDNNKNDYDIFINSVMGTVEQLNGARVEERTTLLKSLNRVFKTLEADSILKASIQKMAETNTTTSGNITDLTEIIRNAKLPEIITQRSLSLIRDYSGMLKTIFKTPPGLLKLQTTSKEPDVINVEKEPEQKPQDTKPIRITIKAAQEAKLLALSKPELIKVVHEEATKAGVHTKALSGKKGGQEFLKIQDAEIKVLNIEQSKKIKKAKVLRKKRIDHYRGTDKRKFDIHKPFKFGDFGITKWDELRDIIPKRMNKVVEDLLNSLSRKRKHQELELEIRIPGLEFNRSLPEGVLLVNNLVIEHLEN